MMDWDSLPDEPDPGQAAPEVNDDQGQLLADRMGGLGLGHPRAPNGAGSRATGTTSRPRDGGAGSYSSEFPRDRRVAAGPAAAAAAAANSFSGRAPDPMYNGGGGGRHLGGEDENVDRRNSVGNGNETGNGDETGGRNQRRRTPLADGGAVTSRLLEMIERGPVPVYDVTRRDGWVGAAENSNRGIAGNFSGGGGDRFRDGGGGGDRFRGRYGGVVNGGDRVRTGGGGDRFRDGYGGIDGGGDRFHDGYGGDRFQDGYGRGDRDGHGGIDGGGDRFRDGYGGTDSGGGYGFRDGGGDRFRRDNGRDGRPRSPVPPYVPVEERLEVLYSRSQPYCTEEAFDRMCRASNCQVYPEEFAPKPLAANSYDNAPLHATLLANLASCGYKKPTPVQRYVIPIILRGDDVLASTPTGTGKTGAYVLPVLDRLLRRSGPGVLHHQGGTTRCSAAPRALVIAPSRELAIQVHNEFRKLSHRTGLVSLLFYGGTILRESLRNIPISDGGCADMVVVGTPGRLWHMICEGHISLEAVEILVLDEVDRLLKDSGRGPGEVEAILSCPQLAQPPPESYNDAHAQQAVRYRQTIMVSATYPSFIQRLFDEQNCFISRDRMFVQDNTIASQIEMKFMQVEHTSKLTKILEILQEEVNRNQKTLVFLNTKVDTDATCAYLCQKNLKAVSIHGGRYQEQREEVLSNFKYGDVHILVATDCASRGLDIPLIAHVINYDLPRTIEDYIHRVGRTGRLGNLGVATSFYDPYSDASMARDLSDHLNQAGKTVPGFLEMAARHCPVSTYGGRRFRGYTSRRRGATTGYHRQMGIREKPGGARLGEPLMTDETWSQAG